MAIRAQKIGTMEYLTADGIGAAHGFTTRLGGVSRGSFSSLNLGCHRGDDPKNVAENYAIVANALGFDLQSLVLTRQTHSDIVRVVTKADAAGIDNHAYPECDALITNDPGTALGIFTADCTPILLYDPQSGAVGAVHAGWRGTVAKLAGKTVKAMVDTFGCRPENIRAAIGPNIAQCCFQTDSDVPNAALAAVGDAAKLHILHKGDKYYVNLKVLNALSLQAAGVENFEISQICTYCSHDRYWSHRFTKGDRGSQGAFILCEGGSL